MIGSRIAQYEILAKIGQGGMGDVYRARDTRLDRDVAIKMLPKEIAASPERSRRFEQEAKAVAALSHPNILAIYDFGVEGDQSFAVMELLEGQTLAERLLDGPIPPRKTIELGVQIADGLAAAHARGIIHRDIKPANIFITTDGRPKILDFGLARQEETDTSQTQSPTVQTDPGAVMGTVGYMSPEQARGAPLDSRSDIFSLGAVLYEMLSGTRAFGGDSAADIIGSILRDDPAPLREKDLTFSEGLDRIVQHCLEKKAEERFQSARDLGFALANASSTSQTDFAIGEIPSRGRRWPRVVLPIAAVAVFMAALGFWMPRLRSPVPVEPVRLTTLTFSGQDWSPEASPAGDIVAFVSDRDGTARIWLKQVTGGGEAPITEGPDDYPRFSPDGSQILFVRNDDRLRNLYRTSVVGGQTRKLLDDVLEGCWSPDGDQVAFIRMTPVGGQNRSDIAVADVQTGEERVIAQIENRSCYGIRWSPNGEWITVVEGPLTGNVATDNYVDLIDPASGELRRLSLTAWGGSYTSPHWAPSGRSFIIGQSREVLARITGSPGLVMQYDIASKTARPLFWAPLRLPTAGWGFSSLAVIGANKVVMDVGGTRAELHEIPLTGDATATRVLTSGMGGDRQPAFSPDGNRVIFSSNRSGNIDLWVVDRSSGALQQLTDDPADDWDPAFTPDGRNILWSSNRSGNMEIWTAAIDGSRARQVTNDGVDAENPTMTPDGRWVVYSSSNDERLGIWKIHPDGTGEILLAAGAALLAEVSPDGRYTLFSRVRNFNSVIQVVEIETGEHVPFEIELPATTRYRNVVLGRARWSPDGKAIVYIGQDDRGLNGVYIQDFIPGRDTSASRRSLAGFVTRYATESLGLSPNGKSLVISAMFDQRSVMLAEPVTLRDWE